MESLLVEFYNPDRHTLDFYWKGGENLMQFTPKEKGQGLVEYALILLFVAIVVIVILALLGPAIGNVFSTLIPSI